MRHFDFIGDDERARLFFRAPKAFGVDAEPEIVGLGLGATLYCPATRPALADDIARRAARGVTSLVVCLEDAIADRELAAAEKNAIRQLRHVSRSTVSRPLIFIRVRHPEQIPMIIDGLGDEHAVLAGFVIPKFTEECAADYLERIVAASEVVGRRILAMPVLESPEFIHLETQVASLTGARRLLDKYREHIPAIRVGVADLSGAYGLRRSREVTVWDLRVVADVISAVVNVFGRIDPGPSGADSYVIAGSVWEYYANTERVFKPQLRSTPFISSDDPALRAELLAADLDGLIREVVLDRANGLSGKTVIHPDHVAPVNALSVVSQEEYADALDVLATDGEGGAAASSFGNKMNESKPHSAWARRTLNRARVFGVVRDEISFADLLGSVVHR